MRELSDLPFISIIIPVRNEARFIGACLRSILDGDYPPSRRELIVVDGMSRDGTREIVEALERSTPAVRLFNNPHLITSTALNIGIRESKGELIAWMSSHNEYEPDYLTLCAHYHSLYTADNVGGVIVTEPRDPGVVARAIVNVLTNVFGVGMSRFRTSVAGPRWVDTVFGGCYRRDVFDKIGLFNEQLVRGQDMEFNLRMRRAGMQTLLIPQIRSVYYARSRFGEFLRYNWTNGVWTLKPFLYTSGMPVGLRHLVPMFFVAVVLLLAALCVSNSVSCVMLLALLSVYLFLAGLAAIEVGVRHRRLVEIVPTFLIFQALHFSFGAGSLAGLGMVLFDSTFWRRVGQYFRKTADRKR
jgi:glycosyltransferase involved in cell wall biosynthesis